MWMHAIKIKQPATAAFMPLPAKCMAALLGKSSKATCGAFASFASGTQSGSCKPSTGRQGHVLKSIIVILSVSCHLPLGLSLSLSLSLCPDSLVKLSSTRLSIVVLRCEIWLRGHRKGSQQLCRSHDAALLDRVPFRVGLCRWQAVVCKFCSHELDTSLRQVIDLPSMIM